MTDSVVDQLIARAAAAEEAHRWIEAVALYEVALARSPGHVPALLGAAAAAQANGDHLRAVVFLHRAGAAEPGRADVCLALGEALTSAGRLGDAADAFRKARAAAPLDAAVAARLGAALLRSGNAAGAVDAFEAALRLDAAEPLARRDVGAALAAAGRHADAVAAFRRMANPGPRAERAMALLALGDMAGGFAELDAVVLARSPAEPSSCPDWDGGPCRGTLLVRTGADPLALFAMLPALRLARSLADDLVLSVPKPFARLAATLPGVDRVITDDRAVPAVAAVPLLSLPNRLGLTLGTLVPAAVPLVAEAGLVDRWAARLALVAGTPTLGLAWGGGAGSNRPPTRSAAVTLADLAPLADLAGIRLIALERLPSAMLVRADTPSGWAVAGAPVTIEHPGPDFESGVDAFVDCAAVLAGVTAVLAIDSPPLRLAAALGRPGVAVLSAVADWTWRTDGDASPLYPSLTLCRQPADSDAAAGLRTAVRLLGRLLPLPF